MLIEINFESDIPIYTQLRNEILRGIASGKLAEGEILPSVRQLASDIGINMHTVNKAYNILKQEGFLTIDRRKGAVINTKNLRYKKETFINIEKELNPIIAEGICCDISKNDFIEMINKIYDDYKVEE